MTRARTVVFDFFGTLVRHKAEPGEAPDAEPATATFRTRYTRHLAELGYPAVDPNVIEHHVDEWTRLLQHDQHSTSPEAFDDHLTRAYASMARDLGVRDSDLSDAVAAFRSVDQGDVVSYADAPACLESLRAAGLRLAVCSNWGWHLDPFLEQAELTQYFCAAVTSARIGAQKPHPRAYTAVLHAINGQASGAVFVGDSWSADVVGPLEAGFAHAVHLDRGARSRDEHARSRRITTLDQLPAVLEELGWMT